MSSSNDDPANESQQQQEADDGPSSTGNSAANNDALINPYTVLNISSDATSEEIQNSFRLLSRSFHPDKQQGKNREIAQQYFVQFKSSYDILIDPVLRLAYDAHKMEGVKFLLKNPKAYKQMEDILAKADADDSLEKRQSISKQAQDLLAEALQYHSFYTNTRFHKPSTSAEVLVKCNTTHSAFLGEGYETYNDSHPIEVEENRISMSISKSPEAKTSISFSGHSSVANKGQRQASTGTQLSIYHEPSQGTDMNIDLDIGATPQETKLSLSTSRVMSSQTYMATNITASATKEMPLGFALTSHRSMMEHKISSTWVMGLALPKFQMQYGLLSFTTNYPDQPKYTAKFNIGMNYTPVELSMEKKFQSKNQQEDEDHSHIGKFTWAWGPRGIDLKAITSRHLSKYCILTLGLHHVSSKGLTWLFQLQRGSIKFSVPILITTIMSPSYAVKSGYMTMFLAMLDASIGDVVQKSVDKLTEKSNTPESKALKREEILLEREKVKRDAAQQIRLMEKPSELKKMQEEKNNGLVILNAIYSVVGGDSIDVTTALMFWVVKGRLQLPSTTKSSMLGFYNVCHDTPVDCEVTYFGAWKQILEKFLNRVVRKNEYKQVEHVEIPTLLIRYRFDGCLYEISIRDDEALSLPSEKAMKLGGSRVS